MNTTSENLKVLNAKHEFKQYLLNNKCRPQELMNTSLI